MEVSSRTDAIWSASAHAGDGERLEDLLWDLALVERLRELELLSLLQEARLSELDPLRLKSDLLVRLDLGRQRGRRLADDSDGGGRDKVSVQEADSVPVEEYDLSRNMH